MGAAQQPIKLYADPIPGAAMMEACRHQTCRSWFLCHDWVRFSWVRQICLSNAGHLPSAGCLPHGDGGQLPNDFLDLLGLLKCQDYDLSSLGNRWKIKSSLH